MTPDNQEIIIAFFNNQNDIIIDNYNNLRNPDEINNIYNCALELKHYFDRHFFDKHKIESNDSFECAICTDDTSNHCKIFTCDCHSFCRTCLKELIIRKPDATCPLCRSPKKTT